MPWPGCSVLARATIMWTPVAQEVVFACLEIRLEAGKADVRAIRPIGKRFEALIVLYH